MFENFGFGEILLVIIVIIIFFGPKRIPDIAQSIGKGLREFKKAMRDVQDEVSSAVNEEPKHTAPKEQKKLEEPAPEQKLHSESLSKTETEVKS